MNLSELSQSVEETARSSGADLCGVVAINDLPEYHENIFRILPSGRSLVVVAARHSLAAIRSANNQVAQYDVIHTYNEAARSACTTARFLESQGFSSVAVPAFIPIDMAEPKKGMKGEICWRKAGVMAGLGSYGENGLLVTKEFGSAVRISGLVTTAALKADSPLEEEVCDHCLRCLEACPVQALSGKGKINKRLCGDAIFKYGFRFFRDFLKDLTTKPAVEMEKMIDGFELRELWQTFMTGNYYYCFQCQAQCPAGQMPRAFIG